MDTMYSWRWMQDTWRRYHSLYTITTLWRYTDLFIIIIIIIIIITRCCQLAHTFSIVACFIICFSRFWWNPDELLFHTRLQFGIDEVTWRRARLVLRWVTVRNRVLRQTSLSTPREMKNSKYAAVGQWQRSAAGKVTVGLASHQLCVRKTHRLCDSLYYQPFDGHKRPRQ